MNIKKYLILTGVLALQTANIFSFKYRFANHTDHPVMLGLRLGGVWEPQSNILIEPGTSKTWDSEKLFLCLDKMFYIANPSEENINNPETAGFRAADILFIPGSIYNQVIKGFSQLTKSAQEIAVLIAEGIAASEGQAMDLSFINNLDVGKSVALIGGLITKSLCTDRHFDILPTEGGDAEEENGNEEKKPAEIKITTLAK